jgi:hypothetical protein
MWLKTNRHLIKMYVCWLYEIEDSSFDVTYLPGTRNHEDPLRRCCFAGWPWPAVSTGEPNPESQQELFSRLGRDAPCSAVLTTVRAGWAVNRQVAAVTFATVQEGGTISSTRPWRIPPCTSMFVALAGSELDLSKETTTARTPQAKSADHFMTLHGTSVRTVPGLGARSGHLLQPYPAGGSGNDWQASRLARRLHLRPLAHPVRMDVFGEVWPALPSGQGAAAAVHPVVVVGGLLVQVLRKCHNGQL